MLTEYNGQTITYDEVGNPLSYRDGITMTWQKGRELATLTKDNKTISYTYDANGIRSEKNNNGTVTKYFYDSNNKLISLKQGDTQLVFYYDSEGQPESVVHYTSYFGTRYYYIKNLQGDVTKLLADHGTVIANYEYDAYGKLLSITNSSGVEITSESSIALLNPLRYRGYVYDSDTGLYYLQSRYYDPEIGRFVNGDDTAFLGTSGNITGYNLFSYCENNPINCKDHTGTYLTRSISTQNRKKYNCYAYAMGYTDRWLHPGKGNRNVKSSNGDLIKPQYAMWYSYTVDMVLKWVLSDFGSTVRKISSKNATIKSNEYRVAMKVSQLIGPLQLRQSRPTYDFHFVKQDPKTKIWYDKPGEENRRKLSDFNPDGNWKGGYNSKTLYIAVKKTFKM